MKLLYKPLSVLSSVLGGVVAGAVFERLWKRVSGESTVPAPTSTSHGTAKVLAAAALRGLIFGVATASVNRATAKGLERLTESERDA